MKKIILLAVAIIVSMMTVSAQDSALEPGIYAVANGNATHLTYTNGTAINSSSSLLGIEVGKKKFRYKGESAEVQVTGKIVMVINPEKKGISKTPKKYDPFIKSMTPANILIVPLSISKGNRVYDEGTIVEGFNTTSKNRVEFEWEMTEENTFEITADLQPGEYAIVFKPAKLGEYDFTSIYGFCVTE